MMAVPVTRGLASYSDDEAVVEASKVAYERLKQAAINRETPYRSMRPHQDQTMTNHDPWLLPPHAGYRGFRHVVVVV